jgi:methyl-accepting chemotaxis protein
MTKKHQLQLNFVIILLCGLLALGVHLKSKSDFQENLTSYIDKSEIILKDKSANIEEKFNKAYQDLRMIGSLKAVRNIDRYGTNLNEDIRNVILQIYAHLKNNINISEVYLIPVDFEENKIDENTGSLETPILMFDGTENSGISALNNTDPKITTLEQAKAVSEVEIYEYQLIKEQLAYFKEHYPILNQEIIDSPPMIAGDEVISCDNDDYNTTKDDADRIGIVFSVPFYDMQGKLKGAISTVIRNNVIKKFIDSNYAIINKAYNYVLLPQEEIMLVSQAKKSTQYIQQGLADNTLLFSKVVSLNFHDPKSNWQLWVGFNNNEFLNSNNIKSINTFKKIGYSFSVIIFILLASILKIIERNALKSAKIFEESNEKIIACQRVSDSKLLEEHQLAEKQRKEDLSQLLKSFQSSIESVVIELTKMTAQVNDSTVKVSNYSLDTKGYINVSARLAQESRGISEKVRIASGQLLSSIKDIELKTKESSDFVCKASETASNVEKSIQSLAEKSSKVSQIIDVITDIANKINLLALNATIESARAGEAGKGFAVVANEVKSLAAQVARATDEITSQITEMQHSTAYSVESVKEVISIIAQVSNSANVVTQAVEQQSQFTKDITSSIAINDTKADEISQNIMVVEEYAEHTEKNAKDAVDISQALKKQSDLIKSRVDEFVDILHK